MRAVLLLLLAVPCLVSARRLPSGQTNSFQLRHRGPPPVEASTGRNLSQLWVTQRLDHFDLLNQVTWQQRYFAYDEHYTPGGPVLLFLGGEWESQGQYITYGFIQQLVQDLGAVAFDLEHRYFGQSHPTPNVTTTSLRYQSVDQALEDAAAFAVQMKNDSQYDLSGPWLVLGISYSANLAAWARAKFPHIFTAAYASSAPVLAKEEFQEYQEVVGVALADARPECPDYVSRAMDELVRLVERGEGSTIANLFDLCAVLDTSNEDNVRQLYTNIVAVFAILVQPAKPGDIALTCDFMLLSPLPPLETLAYVVTSLYRPNCLNVNYAQIIQYYHDLIAFTPDVTRPWGYLSCTQLGYYQTCSSPNQPFGQIFGFEEMRKSCEGIYGPQFSLEVLKAGVARTNREYGGLNPGVSHVIYTHGSLDPWHVLGLKQQVVQDSPVITIPGASHCYDIHGARESDWPELTDARRQVADTLAAWLKPEAAN